MKIYNTLSRQVEEIVPITAGQAGMYACGPTVYDYTHLGHLRKFAMDDVLVKTIRHSGLRLKFIQNITDVGHLASDADSGEDKLEKGARKYGKSAWEVAKDFEAYFWRSMDLMGNVRPDVSCRATAHIEAQLTLVTTLEKKGFTYVIEGDGVYFDTSKLDDYGKLALMDLDQLREGARVERIPGKKNPTDFAVWKFERPGENRAMVWSSPWGERTFPGWHIECSAMSMQYLGEQYELHTGGIDHINVHHTNEIAQAEAATGKKPFVKYWIHHNFLQIDGEKMSKSLGNMYTIDDVIQHGISPRALRMLFLTSHYRSEMNFTWQNAEGMQKTYERLLRFVAEAKKETGRTTLSAEKLAKIDEYRTSFYGALEDDVKTPEAMAVVWEVTKSNIPGPDKYDLLIEFDEVLGLDLIRAEEILAELAAQSAVDHATAPAAIKELLAKRLTARETRNWQVADEVRAELMALGYQVIDENDGTQKLEKIG